MTGRVVQEVLHHLVAVPAAAAAAGGHRLRSRRPVRSGGGGGRGQVGHGAGEAKLREGSPEVRGGLEEMRMLAYSNMLQNPNLIQHPVPKITSSFKLGWVSQVHS